MVTWALTVVQLLALLHLSIISSPGTALIERSRQQAREPDVSNIATQIRLRIPRHPNKNLMY